MCTLQAREIFKRLHRTRQKVFKGDIETLVFAREKINEDFKINKDIQDPEKIKQLLRHAKTAEKELSMVIQMVETSDNRFCEYLFNR